MFVKKDCLALEMRIDNARTENDKKELVMSSMISTWSAWHCQQKCLLDQDCVLFSWNMKGPTVLF